MALIAHLAFWGLLIWGLVWGDLSRRRALVFVALWLLAPLVLAYLPYGPPLVTSCVALLDIVLVFMIVKGDVRLTQ